MFVVTNEFDCVIEYILFILAFCNIAIFSMWNNANKNVAEISKGPLVDVKKFKYEGTGLQAVKQIDWWPNEPIVFRMEGKYNTETKAWRVKCSIEINNHKSYFMAEFERQGVINLLDQLKFTSFIEDFHRSEGANGCQYERKATFLRPIIRYKYKKRRETATKTLVLNKAHFTVDQNEKCRQCHNWTCASTGSDSFSLKTGGSRLGRPKKMCQKNQYIQSKTSLIQRNIFSRLLSFCISKKTLDFSEK